MECAITIMISKHAIGSMNPGIDYKFIDLDFEKFFESGEFINYGTVYRLTSPKVRFTS